MDAIELRMLESFCDDWSPETKGEDIVARIDAINRKFKDVMLGVEMLTEKYLHQFKGKR